MVKHILSLFVSQFSLNQSQPVRYVNRYRSSLTLLVLTFFFFMLLPVLAAAEYTFPVPLNLTDRIDRSNSAWPWVYLGNGTLAVDRVENTAGCAGTNSNGALARVRCNEPGYDLGPMYHCPSVPLVLHVGEEVVGALNVNTGVTGYSDGYNPDGCILYRVGNIPVLTRSYELYDAGPRWTCPREFPPIDIDGDGSAYEDEIYRNPEACGVYECPIGSALALRPSDPNANTKGYVCIGADPLKQSRTCPTPTAGNPIIVANGNKYQAEPDYQSQSPFGLNFTRYYNSIASEVSTGLGIKWQHNYNRRIDASGTGALAHRSNGQAFVFNYNGTGWQGDADIYDALVEVNSVGVRTGWLYTTSNGIVEQYNAIGQLTLITNHQGQTQSLTYDLAADDGGDGNNQTLDKVTGFMGDILLFSYDPASANPTRIESLTDPLENTYLYSYDGLGNLSTVTYPDDTPGDDTDNPTRLYHYENTTFPHHLTGITNKARATDETGIRYVTWIYDDDGRAESSELAPELAKGIGIETLDYTYIDDAVNPRVTVTSPRGKETTYEFKVYHGVKKVTGVTGYPTASCVGDNQAYTYYPENGQLETKTDLAGAVTEFGDYDTNSNYRYKIEAKGTDKQRRTDYGYVYRDDQSISEKTITEPSVIAGEYRVTTYQYDGFGNQTSVKVVGFKPGDTEVSRETKFYYGDDAACEFTAPLHQLCKIDGPRTDIADITTLEYHSYTLNPTTYDPNNGRLAKVTGAYASNVAITLRSNIQYTATGKVKSEVRPNGLTLDYSYTPGRDRLETLKQKINGVVTRATHWTYLKTGEVKSIAQDDGTEGATSLSAITFGYDDARRLVRIINGNIPDPSVPCSSGAYPDGCIEYTLDTEGNKTDENTHDNTGALKKAIHRAFDTNNYLDTETIGTQVNHTVHSDSSISSDGALDLLTDGKKKADGTDKQTKYDYDKLKRLTDVKQDFGSGETYLNALTQYNYDVQDNLKTVIDPNGGTTTYTYDDLGNLLEQDSPDTGITTFTYDAAGNVKTKTDEKGQLFSYIYDALNRLTKIDAPGTEEDITYNYHNGTNITCDKGIGRLCSITMSTVSVSYDYNGFGEVTKHQDISYSYDKTGRVKTITYLSDAVVTYSYDAAGQVKRVILDRPGQIPVTLAGDTEDIKYYPFGPISSLKYGNGLTLNQIVDQAYQIAGITAGVAIDINTTLYDRNGNLTNRNNGAVEVFNYDALNRLDDATGDFGSHDYAYDDNGNRTQDDINGVVTDYSYEPTPPSNRMDLINATTDVGLDANGNTIAQGVWAYDYSTHNRLTEARENNTVKGNYTYNGLGQRNSKTVDGNTTYFTYGLNGELLAEQDDNDEVQVEYIYLNGQPLAMLRKNGNHFRTDNGNVTLNNNSLTVNESELNGTALYAYDPLSGDGSISVRIDNLEGSLTGAEAGLEVRESTAADANFVRVARYAKAIIVLLHGDIITPILVPHEEQIRVTYDTGSGPQTIDFAEGNYTHLRLENIDDYVYLSAYDSTTMSWAALDLLDPSDSLDGPIGLNLSSGAVYGMVAENLKDNTVVQFQEIVASDDTTDDISTYYIHNDHLGTPQSMTDSAGAVVWRAQYAPFGLAVVDEDVDGDGHQVSLNVRFPGQYFDGETGFYYNYFRTYDPETGRYITSDPIGLRGGLNTYGYVTGNPVNLVDPIGLWSFNFSAYLGIGGGITFGRNENTGNWFVGGQLGFGLGGGGSLDPFNQGPTDRPRKPDPYADPCPELSAPASGTSAGGFTSFGGSYGGYNFGYGGSGGYNFDGTGTSYGGEPMAPTTPNLNTTPGRTGIGLGGAVGIEVMGWF